MTKTEVEVEVGHQVHTNFIIHVYKNSTKLEFGYDKLKTIWFLPKYLSDLSAYTGQYFRRNDCELRLVPPQIYIYMSDNSFYFALFLGAAGLVFGHPFDTTKVRLSFSFPAASDDHVTSFR